MCVCVSVFVLNAIMEEQQRQPRQTDTHHNLAAIFEMEVKKQKEQELRLC